MCGGDRGIPDKGRVVACVDELSEEAGFVGGEIEADEVVEFGGNGDDEFVREDQYRAGGGLDVDFDAVGAATVGSDDVAV